MRDDQKQFLLDNPDAFLGRYFAHRLNHRLEPFHLDLIKTAHTERRGLVLYPAAHGKTTIVSTLLPIWAICKDPNVRIVDYIYDVARDDKRPPSPAPKSA